RQEGGLLLVAIPTASGAALYEVNPSDGHSTFVGDYAEHPDYPFHYPHSTNQCHYTLSADRQLIGKVADGADIVARSLHGEVSLLLEGNATNTDALGLISKSRWPK